MLSVTNLWGFMAGGGDPFWTNVKVLHQFNNAADVQGRTWVADADPVTYTTSASRWSAGNGVSFSGSAVSRLEIISDASPNCTGDFTLEFWYRVPSGWGFDDNNPQSILSAHCNLAQLSIGIEAGRFTAHRLFFNPIDRLGGDGYQYGTAITDTDWHFIQFIRQGYSQKLYLDGVLSSQYTTVSVSTAFTAYTRIGGTQFDGLNLHTAYMDDFRLTNIVRPVVVPTEPFPIG